MLARLIDLFFGCGHSHLSFPMTAKRTSRRCQAAFLTGTYVVCLDCGREFAYDWQRMKIVDAVRDEPGVVADLAAKHAS